MQKLMAFSLVLAYIHTAIIVSTINIYLARSLIER